MLEGRFRESDVSGTAEGLPMNCQSCNTEIDYRFRTNCVECDSAVDPVGPVPIETIPTSQPVAEVVKKRLNWSRRLVNLLHLLVSATSGMLFGAVVIYLLAAVFFMALFSFIDPNPNPSVSCGRGQAIGFLSLVAGAFLGTVGGTFYSAKRPLYQAK